MILNTRALLKRLMLVNSKQILEKAKRGSYAVPQFNCSNLEIILGIKKAAKELNSSVIFATSENEILHSNELFVAAMVKTAAEELNVSVSLHLDHGHTFEQAKRCIDAGYTSVHIDGSELSYEENITLTKKVAEYAHLNNVQVEGEIGRVLTPNASDEKVDRSEFFTKPEEAVEFIEKTEIDSLAISIGTAHGAYKGETRIDFDRLEKIADTVGIPLVLHGGSMVTEEDIKKAITLGISKININTELRLAFSNYLREFLQNHPEEYVPGKILDGVISEISKVCEEKIKIFGSNKK